LAPIHIDDTVSAAAGKARRASGLTGTAAGVD